MLEHKQNEMRLVEEEHEALPGEQPASLAPDGRGMRGKEVSEQRPTVTGWPSTGIMLILKDPKSRGPL